MRRIYWIGLGLCLFAQAMGGANATETAGLSAYRYWFNTDTLRYELPCHRQQEVVQNGSWRCNPLGNQVP
jgi:hypothetical protein